MSTLDLNYFTCTLGEAAQWKALSPNRRQSFKSVLDMIDQQAKEIPELPALGFADFSSDNIRIEPTQVTFSELRNLSLQAANTLSTTMDKGRRMRDSPETVALICKTSLDFILTWLGLTRLGYVVLFIAPQLDSRAIRYLCEKSRVKTLVVQPSLSTMVKDLKAKINVLEIPPYSYNQAAEPKLLHNASYSNTSHIFHSSGTSSGLPKPLPQSQHCAVGALPRLPGTNKPATFTTTPLYHGGLADCLRSWSSDAMIWLFPESIMPITGSNIVTALHFSQKHSSMGDVKYFSSVPSVLQMMMEQGTDGLELLRSMELVGFGGAALPISIGNELVSQGVRLVSRMGSAECGFLLCSARHNYDKDKEWQFLRCKVDDDMMAFEQRGQGLFELIVKPGWPLREHSNRSDGSFATADLFEQHPSIRNAWRYHSRADAQIALDNGKKFDPSPIEDTILAEASSLLDGVLVFGAGRTYPGALLLSKEGCDDDGAVVNAVWPSVEKVNEASPSHARISRAMLVVVPNTNGPPPLEKSSKGTIMRGKAEKRYAQYIEDAYTPAATAEKTNCVRMEDIPGAVFQSFTQVLGRELDPDKDLYLQGVDSMTCNHVRRLIEAEIMPSNSNKLPMNVIYDNGSINKLGRFLQGLIAGSPLATLHDDANVDLMRELAAKYSRFGSDKRKGRGNHRETEVIVLTGATGMLGAHILHELLSDSRVSTTFCLVRAKDPETATERIQDSLLRRGFPNSQIRADQVVCVPCDLSRPDLGLSNLHRQRLTHAATMYIHAAWPVNFSLRLTSFESQLEALYNLLKMAATNEARFHFISSTASVVQSHHNLIPEEPSFHPRDAGPLGYAQSKWVAEQICAAAHTSFSNVGIIRVGQLCGNKKGIWNMSEAWPLMLSTAKLTSCLPDLQDEVLGWFPVDQAAGAILDIIIPNETIATATKQDIKVFHVHNAHRTPTWSQMLQWIKENEPSLKLEIVPPLTWTMRLEEVLGETGHPSKGLLYFWKDRYAERIRDRGVSEKVVNPSFGVVEAEKASAAVRNLSPLDKEAVMRMCTWIFNK